MLPVGVRPHSWAWMVFLLTLTSVSFKQSMNSCWRDSISQTFSLPIFWMAADFSSLLNYKEANFARREKYQSLLYRFSAPFFLEMHSIKLRQASGRPFFSISQEFGDFLWSCPVAVSDPRQSPQFLTKKANSTRWTRSSYFKGTSYFTTAFLNFLWFLENWCNYALHQHVVPLLWFAHQVWQPFSWQRGVWKPHSLCRAARWLSLTPWETLFPGG